jgi:transcription antitermination factor NusA-like protein
MSLVKSELNNDTGPAKSCTRHATPPQARRAKQPKAQENDALARVGSQGKNVEELTRELDEALQQQAATSEVLHIVSGSPSDVSVVFQKLLAHAARIIPVLVVDTWCVSVPPSEIPTCRSVRTVLRIKPPAGLASFRKASQ